MISIDHRLHGRDERLPRNEGLHTMTDPRSGDTSFDGSEPASDTQSADRTVLGAHMHEELSTQPETWARAAGLIDERAVLPASGARVAVIGCGTSWFMAQSYAALRERGGHGVTDAYAASEAFVDRDYDAVVAITRSGTTTEVLELLDAVRGRIRTVGIVGDPNTPLVDLADDVVKL
jgi:fructoselysine-6-P-deglycase FrlB-like protein